MIRNVVLVIGLSVVGLGAQSPEADARPTVPVLIVNGVTGSPVPGAVLRWDRRPLRNAPAEWRPAGASGYRLGFGSSDPGLSTDAEGLLRTVIDRRCRRSRRPELSR